MGKAKHNKRARTRDGMVFSRVDKALLGYLKLIKTQLGSAPFTDSYHPFWQDTFRAWANEYLTKGEIKAYPILLRNTLTVLYEHKWRSIYVASDAVVDFIEHSDFRESDNPLVEKAALAMYEDIGEHGLVVHYANRQDSLILHRLPIEDEVFVGFSAGDVYGALPTERLGSWHDEYKQQPEQVRRTLNTLINLYLYMDVFPECVSDKPPQIITGQLDTGPTRTIGTSKEIEEVYRQAHVSPHMRRGHFRVLKAARYTKKKGQAIYVKPTMVRGSVRTVVENAQDAA